MTMQSTTRFESREPATLPGAAATQANPPVVGPWESRTFGALVLAAFVLYGVGSAQPDQPIGLALVSLNSLAVTIVGLIGFRLLRSQHRRIGTGYLAARVAEAVLLAGGVGLVAFTESADADTTGYLLAMIALGLGSVPFCHVLGQGGWLPTWLARWGVVGYALLVAGALLELTTGRAVTLLFAVPGGLFELTLGLYLLWRGFGHPGRVHASQQA